MAYQSWDDLVGMSAKDPRLRLLGANQAQQPSQVSSTGVPQPGSMSKQQQAQPTQSPDGAMMAAIQKRMRKNQLDPTSSTNTSASTTPNAY